jgi:hypothetical protein
MMLYWLAEYLDFRFHPFDIDFALALSTAFSLGLIIGPRFINMLESDRARGNRFATMARKRIPAMSARRRWADDDTDIYHSRCCYGWTSATATSGLASLSWQALALSASLMITTK